MAKIWTTKPVAYHWLQALMGLRKRPHKINCILHPTLCKHTTPDLAFCIRALDSSIYYLEFCMLHARGLNRNKTAVTPGLNFLALCELCKTTPACR